MAQKKDMKKKPAKKEQSKLIKAYLFLYNFIQVLGWSYLLFQIFSHYLFTDSNLSLYDEVKWTVNIFQNAAVLEILHAFTKLVPSNPFVTTVQVFSRVFLVCGVLMPTTESRIGFGLPLALFAWTITEIIRYSYYAINIISSVPSFIIYLRYTTFIALYPIGVTGELLCLWGAQNEIGRTNLWTVNLPNMFNFSFHYQHFLIIIMLLYIPIFPQMYLHMFAQRKKILGHAKSS